MFKTCIVTLVILLCLGLHAQRPASAGVVISAIEFGGNVEFNYSGTLDLSGLSFTTGNPTTNFHELSLYPSGRGSFINAFASEDDGVFFSNPYSSEPGINWLERDITADEFSGDQLVLLPTADLTESLRLHASDLSGNTWSGAGKMQFNNTSIADLGLDLSVDRVWTINNSSADTIRLTTVPEPNSSGLLLMIGAGLAKARPRRVRRGLKAFGKLDDRLRAT